MNESAIEQRDQEILEKRAAALARVPGAAAAARTVGYLAFVAGGETYAIEMAHVRQIISRVDVAPLPGAQAPLVGVIAWRGEMVPAFILGAAADDIFQNRQRAIVIGENKPRALIVSEIRDLIELATSDVYPMPASAARNYAVGITSEAVVVLDATALIKTFG